MAGLDPAIQLAPLAYRFAAQYPHPVPLGEGTPSQRPRAYSLSRGERVGARGVTFGYDSCFSDSGC